MASGTAARGAASGSLPEVVGSAALLADPHDPDPWAEAIERVATDGELRSSLLNEGRRHQAQFTWARTAEETLAVYDELLGTA
jgi:glycosyltransferase involved in cell wall biosynthesis